MGFALGFMLLLAVWQGRIMNSLTDKVAESEIRMVTHYGDVDILRAFLESHRHDFAVCSMCTYHADEKICNSSVSFVRKELCMDIMRHCRSVCNFSLMEI
jgi:hypothetical protein